MQFRATDGTASRRSDTRHQGLLHLSSSTLTCTDCVTVFGCDRMYLQPACRACMLAESGARQAGQAG